MTEVAGQEPKTEPNPTPDPATQEPKSGPKTFDEDYVKSLRDEAASYRTKLRKLEEAEQKRSQAELSETERLKAEKEQAETRANEALTKASQRAVRSEARVAALDAGANPKRVAALLKLSDLSDIEVDDDGEPDAKAVKQAVEAALKEYPEFKASKGLLTDGFNPGGEQPTGEKNPWSKEHFNLTEQGNIMQKNPALAAQLQKAAQA